MELKYNIRLFTIIANILFFSALLLPKVIPESYRFGELNNIWGISRMIMFIFHGIAVLITIINIAFIIPKFNENRKKYYILIFSHSPIIAFWIWVCIMIISIL